MAFGFPASYETQCDLVGARRAAREALEYTFNILGWDYEMVNPNLFRAKVSLTSNSWGETFTVSLETPDVVEIKSACNFFQLFDWGKNKNNVDQFLAHFSQKELRETMLEPPMVHHDESGRTPVERLRLDE